MVSARPLRVLLACLLALPFLGAARPRPFTFAVLSDVHMDLPKLGNAFRDLGKGRIDTAVMVGDSCDGQAGEYAELKAFLGGNPHPERLFFTMGNHEYYASYHKDGGDYDEAGFPNGETSEGCRRRFNAFRGASPDGPVYHDARVAGFHFIFLAGERSRMDDPKLFDDAVLSGAQLAWLKARLAEDRPGAGPVFVFLHQPFQGTVSGSGSQMDGSRSIQQESELKAILSARPDVFFFSGHTHWQLALPGTHYTDPSFGIHLFNTSSLRDPYNARDQAVATSMSEGLLVTAEAGRVVVRGRDFLGHRDLPGQRFEIRVPFRRP